MSVYQLTTPATPINADGDSLWLMGGDTIDLENVDSVRFVGGGRSIVELGDLVVWVSEADGDAIADIVAKRRLEILFAKLEAENAELKSKRKGKK
jgi:hypothetical protein